MRWLPLIAVGWLACTGEIAGRANTIEVTEATGSRITRSGLRRLTAYEYDNALTTLLADVSRPGVKLLPPDYGDPFDNEYARQLPSQQLIEAAELLSQNAFKAAIADPARRSGLTPCTPTGRDDATCLGKFVAAFGRRAFRRELSSEEVQTYVSTFLPFATETHAALTNDFYTAVSLAGQAILQDPEFLYRIEAGGGATSDGIRQLTDYEIATRLSFFLWSDLPDEALLADAQAGRLSSVDARRTIASRMLSEPRGRRQIERFHAYWLGYKTIPHSAQLVASFAAETNALVNRVVFEERGPYQRLFTSPQTLLDATLATQYGMSGSGWVDYPATSKRAGILSHGAVLSAFSKFSDTSPTQRGIFVRTRLLCLPPLVPPASVDVDSPPPPQPGRNCKVDRYEAHRTSTACAGCHAQLDPIGFGLENFNNAGVWRTHDDGDSTCTIDGQGNVPGAGEFNGPAQLGQRLVESGLVQACAARQLFRFASGRTDTPDDRGEVDYLVETFRQKGYAFAELVLSLVADEAFGFKRDEP